MKPKIVVMPPPPERRLRIRIGSAVYELRVNVAITPVRLQLPGPLIVRPAVSASYPK